MSILPSPLGLGCYPLGGGYGAVDDAQAARTVDAALDAGWTFLDTAETYLQSEERLGAILEGRRDRVFLATKAFPSEPYTWDNLRTAVDSSLRRLRTDRIDLYQLHGPQDWVTTFPGAPGYEEIGDALARLRDSGKVLAVGVCNLPLDALRAVHAHAALASTQNLYSMIDRGAEDDPLHLPVEREIIPFVREADIRFIAFSPLSRGLLADDLDPARTFGPDDERHFLPRYQPDVYPAYVDLARRLQAWAGDHGHSLTELAVAWTLATPGVTNTLVGAKRPEQVQAVARAAEWRLTPGDRAEIDTIIATLPAGAAAARMIVWDHFSADALGGLRVRRHGHDPLAS
ncbi:MAG: aldo/keto reductase [Chloroflexi bacterium]|nr:aldo/keto reductase [Chloroflexota bacterium]